MAEPPISQVEHLDFIGQYSDIDMRQLPPGAAELHVNVTCVIMGELQVRQGYRVVTFEND